LTTKRTPATARPQAEDKGLVQLSKAKEKLYGRLYVSMQDVASAREYARVLLKKGWHHRPWERRWSVYRDQAAFTSALVVAYGRPFTTSRGWPKFPSRLKPYTKEETALHDKLLVLRHRVYAHSDSASYSIRPRSRGGFSTTIVGQPPLRLTAEETTLFVSMTEKLTTAIRAELRAILEAGQLQTIKI
jgi:hypothetical protein